MSQMIVAASPSADFHGSPLVRTDPLHLDATTFRTLFIAQGPSLGLWRAAEIAALREQSLERPILDLGCGDGFVTAQTLRRVGGGLPPPRHGAGAGGAAWPLRAARDRAGGEGSHPRGQRPNGAEQLCP